MDDFLKRRHLIKTLPNPNKSSDYLIRHEQTISDAIQIVLRFIPDNSILDNDAHRHYVQSFADGGLTPETIAAIILADMNNQLIPRWLHVEITSSHDGNVHQAVMEDRQPRWKNDAIMARLKPL